MFNRTNRVSPYGYLSFTPTAPGKARQHKIELDRTTNSVWKNPDPHPPPPPLPPSQEFREGQRFTGTVTKDSLADRTGGGRGTTLKEFVAKGQTKGGVRDAGKPGHGVGFPLLENWRRRM